MELSETIKAQFAALRIALRAHQPGAEVTLIVTSHDFACTALTSLANSGLLRASLANVLADSILSEGHGVDQLPRIAVADFAAAVTAAQTRRGH